MLVHAVLEVTPNAVLRALDLFQQPDGFLKAHRVSRIGTSRQLEVQHRKKSFVY